MSHSVPWPVNQRAYQPRHAEDLVHAVDPIATRPQNLQRSRQHLRKVWTVVVVGQREIHELIDQQAAAGRVSLESQVPVDDVLAQPPEYARQPSARPR